MRLRSESIREGIIKGEEFAAFYTELPNGKIIATVARVGNGVVGLDGHVTKMCDTKEEAIDAINEAWADLDK